MPKQLSEMSVEELKQALVVRTFEANVIVRALDLLGVRVDMDVVDRTNIAHPNGYPEILLGIDDAD